MFTYHLPQSILYVVWDFFLNYILSFILQAKEPSVFWISNPSFVSLPYIAIDFLTLIGFKSFFFFSFCMRMVRMTTYFHWVISNLSIWWFGYGIELTSNFFCSEQSFIFQIAAHQVIINQCYDYIWIPTFKLLCKGFISENFSILLATAFLIA